MEEKLLIKSERYNIKKFCISLVIIGALITGILCLVNIAQTYEEAGDNYDVSYAAYLEHKENGSCFSYSDSKCWDCESIEEHPSEFGYIISVTQYYGVFHFPWIPFIACALISAFCYLWLRSYELIVTDKRIYGKSAFGKRVDLPLDLVSAVATSALKGIAVGTSSGKIKFILIKNQKEIHSLISNRLIERQKKEANNTKKETQTSNITNADEIKKYKDLLDAGTITQEEFEAKKKQLLGL